MDTMTGVIKAAASVNPALSGKIAGAIVAAAELHLTGLPQSKRMIEKQAINAAGDKAVMREAIKEMLPGKLTHILNEAFKLNIGGRDRLLRR